jgi:uncharacterized membrane protein
MIPLYVMIAGVLVARAAGAAGVGATDSWQGATRVGLAIMFMFTGVAHFTATRADLIRMVPPVLPRPDALVAVTGVAELAGAIALLFPAAARVAAYALMALLIAMFPANVHAARSGQMIAGRRATPLAMRLPLQVLWIGLLWWCSGGEVRGE